MKRFFRRTEAELSAPFRPVLFYHTFFRTSTVSRACPKNNFRRFRAVFRLSVLPQERKKRPLRSPCPTLYIPVRTKFQTPKETFRERERANGAPKSKPCPARFTKIVRKKPQKIFRRPLSDSAFAHSSDESAGGILKFGKSDRYSSLRSRFPPESYNSSSVHRKLRFHVDWTVYDGS